MQIISLEKRLLHEDVDGNEVVYDVTFNDYGRTCKSCTLDAILLIITFIIIMDISGGVCFYFYWHTLKNNLINYIINYAR